MSQSEIVRLLWYCEPVFSLFLLGILFRTKQLKSFLPLSSLLVLKIISWVTLFALKTLLTPYFSGTSRYHAYFYSYWTFYLLESVFIFWLLQNMFKQALNPLDGIKKMGMRVFQGVAVLSVLLAIATSLGPHVTSSKFIIAAVSQIQRSQSIITLCLLLFVCFAAGPLGMSYRSRIFGVSLGLGILSTSSLVLSVWIPQNRGSIYTWINVANGAAILCTMLLWAGYFSFPEPKRRFISIPTTSPFLRWNQISLALGHDPGHVVIGKVGPEVFAPAELKMLEMASAKMKSASAV